METLKTELCYTGVGKISVWFNQRVICSLLLILVSFKSHSGLIIDTDQDSFIDTTTGLEWMDFGINQNQAFSYVAGQLETGGHYENWRLPTALEVYVMWSNVANLDGVEAYLEKPDRYGTDQFWARDYNDNTNTESVFDDVFKLIGANDIDPVNSGIRSQSYGFFEGTDGLSFVEFYNMTEHPGIPDLIRLVDNSNYDSIRDLAYSSYSTLLIKDERNLNDIAEVPEPSSLALFGLAMLGLISVKRVSNKFS